MPMDGESSGELLHMGYLDACVRDMLTLGLISGTSLSAFGIWMRNASRPGYIAGHKVD